MVKGIAWRGMKKMVFVGNCVHNNQSKNLHVCGGLKII